MGALQMVLERKDLLPNLEKFTLEGDFDAQKHLERLDSVKDVVRCARAKDIKTVVVKSASRDLPLTMGDRGWGLDECIHWQEAGADGKVCRTRQCGENIEY